MKISTITTSKEAEKFINLSPEEKAAIHRLQSIYPFKVTDYYLSLLEAENHKDPLRKIVIPSMKEIIDYTDKENDDVHSNEANYQPCPGIVHRYPGKLLLFPSYRCPAFCRFCYRKGRKIKSLTSAEEKNALDYIRSEKNIRDVIITGGEPLSLSNEKLHFFLSELYKIDHIEIIRITSRYAIYDPSRIDEELVKILSKHRPLFFIFSFVHPREITSELTQKIRMLADAGINLLQQGPILKGINDDSKTLKALYEKLIALQIVPYYAAWGLEAKGAKHFMISGKHAARLMNQLENKTSGMCIPHLITMAGGTKVRTLGWSEE